MDTSIALEESQPGLSIELAQAVRDEQLSSRTVQTYQHWIIQYLAYYDLKNPSLVKGTMVGTKNYCKLNFTGPRKDRRLNIQVIGPEGQVHWKKTINSSLLTHKE